MPPKTKICVIGLGYVGLPLAVAFAKAGKEVFGFDIKKERIQELKKGIDSADEIKSSDLRRVKICYSADPKIIQKANFIIAAIPTPVDRAKRPDLSLLKKATKTIGENIRKGAIVVFESTVYPGLTEEICVPIIEKYSHLNEGSDWHIGYSPERINPGDREHAISKIIKIVSASNKEALEKTARIYGSVCKAGIYKAPNIKTAEAAKVIENIQRDLNIALMNELSLIFHRLDINTQEVLEAAATKWNFHTYQPGMPSGHCLPVDPYYLTYRAEELGYHPQVILAGRRINDSMPQYVAELTIQGLIEAGKRVQRAKVLVMGLTFKENVKDIRNSKAKEIIETLKKYKVDLYAHDPLLSRRVMTGFEVKNISELARAPKMDGIVLCLVHKQFKKISLKKIQEITKKNPVLIDVKSHFLSKKPERRGFIYKSL